MTIQEIKASQKRTAQDMKAISNELKDMYKDSLKNNEPFAYLQNTDEWFDLSNKLNRLSNQAEELAIKLDKATKEIIVDLGSCGTAFCFSNEFVGKNYTCKSCGIDQLNDNQTHYI